MRIKYAHYQPPVRHHGKPLVSIEERPVPQNASQHTSPTQPIPVGDDVVPHFIDAALETGELLNEGRTFTPFDAKPVLYKQSPASTGRRCLTTWKVTCSMTVATTGRKEMPSFRQVLSEKELRDVAAYASHLLAK